MAIVKLKWSNLLKLTELEFIPDFPAQLSISDEVLQVISWLTGTTGFDRRLIRCTPQGALLFAEAWSMMQIVANYELSPETGSPTTRDDLPANKGILVVSSTDIIEVGFVRKSGGAVESIYMPPAAYYWFPNSCYSVTIGVVPPPTGTSSYVGINLYN